MLPEDPYILLSYVNTKLRDCFPSLDALCEDLDIGRAELSSLLDRIGLHYDPQVNQFR